MTASICCRRARKAKTILELVTLATLIIVVAQHLYTILGLGSLKIRKNM